MAAFTYRTPARTLKYIAPTDRDMIMFLNNSTDPDGDPLTSQWSIRFNGTGEWRLLNSSRDHWSKLPASNEKGHEVKLVVFDGMKETYSSIALPVDVAWQYDGRPFGVPIKGMTLIIGRTFGGVWGTPLTDDELDESLTVIRDELGCNGIFFTGDYEDIMLKGARIAIDKKFESILLGPRYRSKTSSEDNDIEEHIRKIGVFAERAEELRQKSDAIVLVVGNELSVDVMGVTDGKTYSDRLGLMSGNWGKAPYSDRLDQFLRRIVDNVRLHYYGRITYASAIGERANLKWGSLGLDIVGPHVYFAAKLDTRSGILRTLASLRGFGKPLFVSEFGCTTFEGASGWGSDGWRRYENSTYSQVEQVKGILDTQEVISAGRVDAAYLYVLLERKSDDRGSFGVLKYNGSGKYLTRKLGFYAYQSFILN